MRCKKCPAKATWKLIWAGGRGVVYSCASHKNDIQVRIVSKNPHADIVCWRRCW